ncbi:conserved exported protein of unknown function [Denitratisoma oestradiolicum]|uniref:NHL repeat containing protein n=1 Tax=Denitratisoma oestradiolicum TaxID=311182 RepID=A0A6S6Y547_9PROT|nr:conserved exported protein of unknown function [Denitratisoma oestradiolicum]
MPACHFWVAVLWLALSCSLTWAEEYSATQAAGKGLLLVRSIHGARLLPRTAVTGLEGIQPGLPGTLGGLVDLNFPVAVAVTPQDIYIADFGTNKLYRYDRALDAIAIMPDVVVSSQTRLAAGPDGSVVVVTPDRGVARRYYRGGRLMMNIDPRLGAARYDDVALDPGTGRYYGLDRAFGRLEEIHPLGTVGTLLQGLLPDLPLAIAWDRRVLYVVGSACRCLMAVSMDTRSRGLVADGLKGFAGLAAGDGWVVIAENGARRLRILREGALAREVSYESLGLFDPRGMALERDMLYVADPGTRRIAVFRLQKP